MSETITVRPITPADFDDVARIKVAGFGGDEARQRANLEDNPRYNYTHVVAAELAGEMVGVATAFPAQMWLSGVPVQAGAVAGVTTLAQFRGRGAATQMMQALLERMRQEKTPLSILYPFSHAFYRRLGYGTASLVHVYRVAPGNLPPFPEAAAVRPFSAEDLPAVRSLYRGQLSWFDGRLARTNAWWEAIMARAVERNEVQVVYDADGIHGYLRYSVREQAGGARELVISEMFSRDDAAYRGLWGYLAGQTARLIHYYAPPDEPLYQLLADPLAVDAANRGWVFNDVYTVTPGFMLRLVHLAEALTARFYPSDMLGEVVLKIDDPQLPANAEPVALRLVDGRPETAPAGDRQPQIESDIVTFSQVYCGFLTPTEAHRLRRLQAGDDALAWLSKAMATQPLFIHGGDWF